MTIFARDNDLTAVAARNSGQQGQKARHHVAQECHAAAEDLFRHTGTDIRDLVPSVPDLVDMLKTRAVRKTSIDSKTGKPFTNEFLTLHLSGTVVLFISTGTGKKIDNHYAQPYLEWLNGELKAHQPGTLVWHRLDRVFRTPLLGATTLHLCDELGIQIIDGEKGALDGDFGAIMALLRARESAEEASRIPAKTRSGQISRTGTDMALGSVPYGVALAPPPGMMTVRMKAPNGQRGEGRLFFDAPGAHPNPTDVAYGLPEVFLDEGRVDQVANVRFALSHLGRPGWTINQVGRALILRGFSTQRLRMEHTAATAFTASLVGDEVHRVVRPIVERLEFYRTGTLPVKFGINGVKDIEIINCFPDGAPWASDEDFERIDVFLTSTKGGGPASQGLTGVIVNTVAGALPLRAAPACRSASGPAYIVRPSEAGVAAANINLPPLPHAALASSLVEALAAHAEELLTPLVQQELPEAETMRRDLRSAQENSQTINRRAQAMLDAMTDTKSDGTPLLDGPAREALVQRYNDMSENELAAAEAEVVRLTEELKQLTTRSMKDNPAIRSDLLLHIVSCLRDPHDTTYNHLWKGAVRIDKISRVPIRVHDTAGTITRWEGTIRTAGGGHEFSAPFHGEYLDGAAAQLPGKVDEAVKNLLEGVPFEAIAQTNARGVRLALAERLGFDSRYFGLPTCRDPRLVRIAAHLAVDPGRDAHQVARLLKEPLSLVREVLSQLTSGRPTWESVDTRSRTSPPVA